MHKEFCNNCGFQLTDENIMLACDDAGMPQEELVFCCPSYDGEKCDGYAVSDRELIAYWRTV